MLTYNIKINFKKSFKIIIDFESTGLWYYFNVKQSLCLWQNI